MMPRLRSFFGLRTCLVLGGAAAVAAACAGSGFDAQSKVSSVRMFGVRADKPYARPGDVVTLELLATDARRDKPRPLKIHWIPIVCVNPRDDLYYACFLPAQTLDGGTIDGGTRLVAPLPGDGGAAPPAGVTSIPTGIDLSAFLPEGPTFQFRMPDDAIVERPGSPPYGLAIVFNIACAGQVRFRERSGSNPQQVPIRCTDEAGNDLGADDYVIGINRVYAYADRANANPVVEGVTLDGGAVDPAAGVTVSRCIAQKRDDCSPVKLDLRVSDSSWEESPGFGGAAPQREQIWVTYYSDLGDFRDEARLLFDPRAGRVSESGIEFRAPYEPSDGTIWAVVHDNRVGASFVVLPLHVR